MGDPAILLMCIEPDSAQKFLRRLQDRQRNQILIIILASLFGLGFAAATDQSLDSITVFHVVLGLSLLGLIAALARLWVKEVRSLGTHVFRDESARIYTAGIYNSFQEVDVRKMHGIPVSPVTLESAHFCLAQMIFRHSSAPFIGGVFPVYFCLRSTDMNHILEWCRERKIDVEDDNRVTSPNKLPLFIR